MHLDGARSEMTDTEEALHELRSLCTDQSAEAEDLALTDVEAAVLEGLRVNRGKMLCLEDDVADLMYVIRIYLRKLTTDHLRDDIVGAHLGCRPGTDIGTISHDGDVVGDPLDLIHLMRDVDHRNALITQLIHNLEEEIYFLIGKGGRRLIEDDDSRFMGNRLCDLDHLHLSDGERAEQRLRIIIETQLLQPAIGLFKHLLVIDHL